MNAEDRERLSELCAGGGSKATLRELSAMLAQMEHVRNGRSSANTPLSVLPLRDAIIEDLPADSKLKAELKGMKETDATDVLRFLLASHFSSIMDLDLYDMPSHVDAGNARAIVVGTPMPERESGVGGGDVISRIPSFFPGNQGRVLSLSAVLCFSARHSHYVIYLRGEDGEWTMFNDAHAPSCVGGDLSAHFRSRDIWSPDLAPELSLYVAAPAQRPVEPPFPPLSVAAPLASGFLGASPLPPVITPSSPCRQQPQLLLQPTAMAASGTGYGMNAGTPAVNEFISSAVHQQQVLLQILHSQHHQLFLLLS